MRVTWISWIVAGTLVAGCGGSGASRQTGPATPPSVLLYVTDTLRADAIGPYGNGTVDTPALDAFARQGTLFEHVQAPSSWTRASVASILTGLYPDATGVRSRSDVLSENLTTLAEYLSRHGYATGCIATNADIASVFGFAQGFDDYIDLLPWDDEGNPRESGFERADHVTAVATEWIDRVKRPFFLFALAVDPHAPYTAPKRFDRYGGRYEGDMDGHETEGQDLSEADRQRLKSLYYAEVSFVDESFGKLIAHIDRLGLATNTIAVFTSDHGEEFWEHGRLGHGKVLYGESVRVPLIMRYPPRLPPGERVPTIVTPIDILPTILDLAGLIPPADLDGTSLAIEPRPGDAVIFSSLFRFMHVASSVTVYPWRLILDMREGRRLFNLADDPGERNDVSAYHPDVIAGLLKRLTERTRKNAAHRARIFGNGTLPPTIRGAELPARIKKSLQALGYAVPDH